ncbi:hypothetical protein EMIT0P291_10693 [Pseudomonas sp. IT-P291]
MRQVAQLDQIPADLVVTVELVDFIQQQLHAVLRPLQTLVGAHDADVVPHESPQFIPVVRNDHVFIGIGDLARIPGGKGGGHRNSGQLFENVCGRRAGINETFKQRVAGHAVGAVQAGETGFANGVQTRHVGAALLIDHHTTAGVVRCRDHRNRLPGDVDGKFQAAFVHRREVRLDESFGLVADVQIDAIDAQALHFMVDGPGDDVPWRQLCPWIEALHEALTVGQLQVGAFASQGFGDQEALGLRVIQASGVELIELQVRHPAARAPGHGDAIAAGAVGVTGVQVNLGRTTGGENHKTGAIGVDFAGTAIEHISTEAAITFQAQAFLRDQVNRHPLFQQFDVRPFPGLVEQGCENGCTRGIGGVDDAPMAVAALAGQVELEAAIFVARLFIAGKGHALVDQPLNGFLAVLDGKAHSVLMAQAAAGIERVIDMGFNGIGIIQDGRNAALGPERRAIGEVALAQNGNAQMTGQGQRKAQAGSTAANYQNIVLKLLAHFRIPLKATRVGGGAAGLASQSSRTPTSI